MYNTKVALLLEAIKVLDAENVHYSLPTMKNRDDSGGGGKLWFQRIAALILGRHSAPAYCDSTGSCMA